MTEGHRYSFGAPSKGWPTFGPDGRIVREARFTDDTLAAVDDVLRHVYGPVIRETVLHLYRVTPHGPLDGELTGWKREKLRDLILTAPIEQVAMLLPDRAVELLE